MFHLIWLCREKGKTVIRKRPSPAERLPSLGRSSRALQYHLYHRIAVLGIFKNSLNIEIASNSDAEWGNAHLITQKQAYVQEGSGFMKAAPVRDIWR